MTEDRTNIVAVGHKDHGKSTLIGRLLHDTGSLPTNEMPDSLTGSSEATVDLAHLTDHLSEERRGGLTIDTTQAFIRKGDKIIVLVDVPGHKRFLGNMLTGACQAEDGLLVLDVTEGVQDQTMRHLSLLALVGISRASVAINKMDLTGFDESAYRQASEVVGRLFQDKGIRLMSCVPISAMYGDNVVTRSARTPWYEGPSLFDSLSTQASRSTASFPFRFSVQGTYELKGQQLALGRVEVGQVVANSDALCLPSAVNVRLGRLRKFEEDLSVALPGSAIAVQVEGDKAVERGDVLCDPANPAVATSKVGARVFWLGKTPLQKNAKYTLCCTTQEIEATVTRIRRRINSSTLDVLETDAESVPYAEIGNIELETDRPVVLDCFSSVPPLGRLVLEDEHTVVGAGIVTDT